MYETVKKMLELESNVQDINNYLIFLQEKKIAPSIEEFNAWLKEKEEKKDEKGKEGH